MSRRPVLLGALVVALAACSIQLADPGFRACDAAHGCTAGQQCDLAKSLCVAIPGAGDGGANDGGPRATVSLQPSRDLLAPGERQRFTVASSVNGLSVNWTVDEGSPGAGTVDVNGLYVAPATEGLYHLTAWDKTDSGIEGHAAVTVSKAAILTAGIYGHFSADALLGPDAGLPLDGAEVKSWKDLTENANLSVPAVASVHAPTFHWDGLNGEPTVQFDGISQVLSSGIFIPPNSQPNTLFFVVRSPPLIADGGATVTLFDAPTGTTERNRLLVTNSPPNSFQAGAGDFGAPTNATVPGQFYVVTVGFNGPATVTRVNGDPQSNGTRLPGDGGMGGYQLGARQDLGIFAQTEFAEVIIYDSLLTATQMEKVEGYLLAKYAP